MICDAQRGCAPAESIAICAKEADFLAWPTGDWCPGYGECEGHPLCGPCAALSQSRGELARMEPIGMTDARADALKLFAECERKWLHDAEMHAIAEAVAINLSLVTGQPPDVYRMPAVMALELKRLHDAQRPIEVCGVCGEPYTQGRCRPDPKHAGYSYCTRGLR